MAVGRVKTWIAGEVLTASDLNAEFNNILNNASDLANPLTKALDMNGFELILDTDADTSITADTDDRVDFRIAGADLFRFDGTATTPVNGLDFVAAAAGSEPSITAQGSDTDISITLTPKGAGMVDPAAAVNYAEGSAVASATTTDVWATDGNTVHVTGTTTITSLGTAPNVGAVRWVIFDGILILTDGANLNLPGSANITTAAGDFARVYADTTTQLDVQYFRADGTAITPSSWEAIATATASSDASIDFNWSGKTYKKVMLVINGATPATNDVEAWLRTSTDGGSTYDSGASDYLWAVSKVDMTATATQATDGDQSDDSITMTGTAANEGVSSGGGWYGNIDIIYPTETSLTIATFEARVLEAGAISVAIRGVGYRTAGAVVDGVQFLFQSGNVASGEFTLYGLL